MEVRRLADAVGVVPSWLFNPRRILLVAVGVGEGATGLFDDAVMGRVAPLLPRSVLADGLSLVRVVVEVEDG